MKYNEQIAGQVGIRPGQVSAAIELLDAGNTVPFLARYRKEVTDSLDEEQLRQIKKLIDRYRTLDERRVAIISSITEQEKMTPGLLELLQNADTLTALEDLYQPFRPKRSTRASVARQKGLQELANSILQQPILHITLDEIAKPFLNELVPTAEEAWAGARDIVAEMISDHPEVRHLTREKAMQWGVFHSEKLEDAVDDREVYQTYYEFDAGVNRMRPHQVLAANRGEQEKVLRIRIEVMERDWRIGIISVFYPNRNSLLAEQLEMAIEDAAQRLLLPAIERDVRRELTDIAEQHAIKVFADNLRALLSQPPLTGHVVLGIDPGFRTGCKIAAVDMTGKLLETATIYPHEPHNKWAESIETLSCLVSKHKITLIAIGNGTASRESEQLVAGLISGKNHNAKYIITNESGASVYSASPLARSELPNLDVTLRGAVSIARRVQDPLAELVKIEPQSIGVGLYQHDINQKALAEALNDVVDSVVNAVGVDVNTASPALLTHIAGIGPKLAEKIVLHREQNGSFRNRESLRSVSGLGPKAYEQSAGFMRINSSTNPLDASAIHPESYPLARQVMDEAGLDLSADHQTKQLALEAFTQHQSFEKLAENLHCGIPTLMDIFEQILRPGRDPREDAPPPILRSDLLKMEDLVIGMRLKGTIRNVVDFGAFIDIGVKQDGLLHRSQIPHNMVLHVGDVINVQIIKIETERGRIGLSCLA